MSIISNNIVLRQPAKTETMMRATFALVLLGLALVAAQEFQTVAEYRGETAEPRFAEGAQSPTQRGRAGQSTLPVASAMAGRGVACARCPARLGQRFTSFMRSARHHGGAELYCAYPVPAGAGRRRAAP